MDDPRHAMNALKSQKGVAKHKSLGGEIRDEIIGLAVMKLFRAQDSNGGRLPHQKMAQVIQGLAENGIAITRHCLNRTMKKQQQGRRPFAILDVNRVDHTTTQVSSLHGTEGVENPVAATANKGRPFGSTKVNIAKAARNKRECITAIAKQYQGKLEEKRGGTQRIVKGYLSELIRQKKDDYGLPGSFYISKQTIQSRVKRKNPTPARLSSPIQAAEESLIQLCIMMGNVHQPLTPTEGIRPAKGSG